MKLTKRRSIVIEVKVMEEAFDVDEAVVQYHHLYAEMATFPESTSDHDLEDHAKNMLSSARDALQANPIEPDADA